MIHVELSHVPSWPDADWTALAARAALAALERTPHGELATSQALIEVSVRLTSDEEVRQLNAQYRGKDKATNVLSFPMIQPDLLDTVTQNSDAKVGGASATGGEVLLGDIVLAHGVCAAEAAERGIGTEQHATHLIVHGVLHLLGYDHQDDDEAEAMEAIETDVLRSLGLADPYLIREDD
ncbi:rRNA maturation RNase YbeY [Sphingomonas sp.]|jgi:probable rRNA maturation factor|uniref:rRNA maturation RNase YbeY n=1 Tax=Sphingomonas sp. TaxID=28214 RepID=UPI002D7ED090|nr:rRNA maturation RNase YbeY [Sphingomonas sp.]HEU0043019.1 rRNA maturation RNase YbeY [Sphingomonas sp.]